MVRMPLPAPCSRAKAAAAPPPIFDIAAGADVRVEVDKILVELHDIAHVSGDFAGYFVKHHSQ